jgi:hypothetical protein
MSATGHYVPMDGRLSRPKLIALAAALLVGCAATPSPAPSPTGTAPATSSPSPTPTALVSPSATLVLSPTPTATAWQPTAKATPPTPAPTPFVQPGNPLADRDYTLGGISIVLSGYVQGLDGPSALLPVSNTQYIAATYAENPSGAASWLVDIDEGATRLNGMRQVLDSAPHDGRLLVLAGAQLIVTDVAGAQIAATFASPRQAAFLGDGSVCWLEGTDLNVWSPSSGATAHFGLASDFADAYVAGVGDRTVVYTELGTAALVDATTGHEVGSRWLAEYSTSIAGSPDGRRFAIAVHDPLRVRSTLQVRDTATGSVLQSVAGDELNVILSLAWLTPDVLLVLRATTGTQVEPYAELRLANDPTKVTGIEPVTPFMQLLAQRGPLLLVRGWGDQILLLHAEQTPPGTE